MEWYGGRYTASSSRNVWRCVGMFSCNWWECRRYRYWLSSSFYSSFEWEVSLQNCPITKGKTCGAEVLSELADVLRKCGLTWVRILGFVRERTLAVNSQKYVLQQKTSRERLLSVVSTVLFMKKHCVKSFWKWLAWWMDTCQKNEFESCKWT